MADKNNPSQIAAAFPIGKLVQLKSGLGREGRARVGHITAHQGCTVMVKFLKDFAIPESCDPADLEEPLPIYLEETPMNVLSDIIDDLRLRFLELHETRYQVEADEDEVLALYNRAAKAYNRLSVNDTSGMEYGRYHCISTRAPSEVVAHSDERVGRTSAKGDRNRESEGATSDGEDVNLSSRRMRSAGELLTGALDKLAHCVDVVGNLIDRLAPASMDVKGDLSRKTGISTHVRRIRRKREQEDGAEVERGSKDQSKSGSAATVSSGGKGSKKRKKDSECDWIGKLVRLSNPADFHYRRQGIVTRSCGVWFEIRLTNAGAVMGDRAPIKRKPCNFTLAVGASP